MKIQSCQLVLILLVVMGIQSIGLDLSKTNKYGQTLKDSPCNKDTIVDFSFSPETKIYNCNVLQCRLANQGASTMKFLNVKGQQVTYTLIAASVYQLINPISRGQQKAFFKFTFMNGNKTVVVGLPFAGSGSETNSSSQIISINLDKVKDNQVLTLKMTSSRVLETTGLPLSGFNFLNQLNYGHFYHIADLTYDITFLLSYWVYTNVDIDINRLPKYNGDSFTTLGANYGQTGDKLCYGSVSQGVFQTHLRQSYPLWTAWIGILLFWVYLLTTNSNTIQCYDLTFQENKWTCWGFYSLHYLGHQEYFTKLSRTTLMLITFSWSGLVCAVIYSQLGPGNDSSLIIKVGLLAVFTGMPFTYLLGYLFLQNIYDTTIDKYEIMKRMKEPMNKQGYKKQGYEKQLDKIQASLYGLYYWYYVIAFIIFAVSWIIAVRQMMQLSRDYYYFMYYWLASLAVSFGLEHLLFDPAMTLVFGNCSFYRDRGFFYNHLLGHDFKSIQD